MTELIYYNPSPILNKIISFSPESNYDYLALQSYSSKHLGIIDRSEVLDLPLKIKILDPLPKFDATFKLSYEDCIYHRMIDLEGASYITDKKFRLLYSGGIDSTLILSAFIGHYGVKKTTELLEIFCTPDAFHENPFVYEKFFRKERFKFRTSLEHNNIWTSDDFTIMGEGNDHIFGNLGVGRWLHNIDNPYREINFSAIISFIQSSAKYLDYEQAALCSKLILKLCATAPIPINNFYLLTWYQRFVLDWQGVMLRILAQSSYKNLDPSNLIQFFNTEDFQQWSLHFHYHYPDRYAEPENYKLFAKDYIIKTLGIEEYRAKSKTLSFPRIHTFVPTSVSIDKNYRFNQDPSSFYLYM